LQVPQEANCTAEPHMQPAVGKCW